jgi:prepilin-type N-terminal cleavage/methylation domain-containing protein
MLQKKGFSLIEILVVLGILAILGLISVSFFVFLQKESRLSNVSEEIISVLKVAQSKTLSSQEDSQYGVYFNSAVSPHQYILFKGSSYLSRDTAFDEIHLVPDITEFFQINTGGNNEIVFDRLTGSTENSGNISLRLAEDVSKTKVIYITNSGAIGYEAAVIPSDTRSKDSRHVNFNYNRAIAVDTESIFLTFDNSIIKQIPIIQNLSGSQFYWEGSVNVNGSDQVIKIHSHRLNDPDTQLCIHRDLRFNNKTLEVTISGDETGSLAEYSANGLVTNYYSIYVNNFIWQ